MEDTLLFEGNLTIQNAETAKNRIVKAYGESSVLQINVRNITSIDLTFIQLLFALKKTATSENKKVIFAFETNEETEYLLKNTGIHNIENILNN